MSRMERLIPVINKLQDVFHTVGERDIIELPQIVVVGAQSSGKSSVLENIVGRDFLPRGTGIVTRVPLIMQLFHVDDSNNDESDAEEWATFLHLPGRVFTDFEEVREEIAGQTDRITGHNKGLSDTPIHLKIYSPHVLNLTMVDLPGITKVAVGDQPVDIESQIRQLILTYIKNPNSIILAVSPANTDLANSDSLKIAKEVDPEGERTLGVITKIDLMDRGTNALEVLSGAVVPIRLGIIGIINRSQYDIDHRKSILEAIHDEKSFFDKHYPTVAHRCGVAYLSKALNKLLMHHIRDCLPSLKSRVKALQQTTQKSLQGFGDLMLDRCDKGALLLQLLTRFSDTYKSAINGTCPDIQSAAQICDIFYGNFGRALECVQPLEGLTVESIEAVIRSTTGTRPALFIIPETAFVVLVKRQIELLRAPILRCLELVYEELERLLHVCGSSILSRFRPLREGVLNLVSEYLKQRLSPTTAMLENLISIELAYINTNHPDFEGGSGAVIKMVQRMTDEVQQSQQEDVLASSDPTRSPEPQRSEPFPTNPGPQSPEQSQGMFRFLFGGKNKPHSGPNNSGLDSPIIMRATSDDYQVSGGQSSGHHRRTHQEQRTTTAVDAMLNRQRQVQVELLQSLVTSYFLMVRKNIQDTVPKAVMHFLVNHVLENVQNKLVSEMYKQENFESMLQEDAHIASQRKATQKMLDALNRAASIISEVDDVSL